MTIIQFIVLIRACGEIQPCIFVASFFILFSRAVSYVHPTKERHIFFHSMGSIGNIRRKEIYLIMRGGQSTKIFSEAT